MDGMGSELYALKFVHIHKTSVPAGSGWCGRRRKSCKQAPQRRKVFATQVGRVLSRLDLYTEVGTTLPPIIMEVQKMGSWKMCLVSKWAISHFHDYGRKGNIFHCCIMFFIKSAPENMFAIYKLITSHHTWFYWIIWCLATHEPMFVSSGRYLFG